MSHVPCHMSPITCHVSNVKCPIIFFFFFEQSGETSRWRVCYQWGQPRLVCSGKTLNYRLGPLGHPLRVAKNPNTENVQHQHPQKILKVPQLVPDT